LTLKEQKLKLMGIMAYWCEGSKSTHHNNCRVDFANCDPQMMKIFILFLRKICGIDETRLRMSIYGYSNQDINKITKYWSRLLKVPCSKFIKPYVRTDFDISKKDRMPYGLAHIRYHDKKLLILIKNWIEDIKNKIDKK
jgi:hypothetical protein